MQITFQQVTALASGRWERIHRALGVAPANTSHLKHTPCPCCGGRDRFRVTNRYAETGGWICSQGGGDTTGGDGFALLQHYGYSAAEALKMVARECNVEIDAEIDQEELDRRRRIAEAQAKKAAEIREAEQASLRTAAINRVRYYLKVGTRPRHHPYLDSKMLASPHNTLDYKGRLIVTMHDASGELTGCQMIFGQAETWESRSWEMGGKYILSGSQKKGSWHWLQSPPQRGQPIAITEGWATGASLVEPEIGFNGAVAIAFDAGNIPTVCASLLTLYPSSRIVIYRDFDKAGVNAANAAVALDPSRVSVMEPPANAPAWATDWNDWMVFEREKYID